MLSELVKKKKKLTQQEHNSPKLQHLLANLLNSVKPRFMSFLLD